MLQNGNSHPGRLRLVIARLGGQAARLGQPGHLPGRQNKQAADEDRLGYLAILVRRRLERLARLFGEGVQVKAVVPIGPADKRQPVWPQPVNRITDAALEWS